MIAMRNTWNGWRNGRSWLTVLMMVICIGVVTVPAYAGPPTDSMKTTIDEVLRIVREKELKQPEKAEERRHLLEKVVAARFDYAEMSRRALGAPWNQLTDQQKQEFVGLFRT
jgi:phospholipid transport system substrate-binding protein